MRKGGLQVSVDSERITFPVSLRKRDRDLMSIFALYVTEKGDRSEFARQLMRDGLRHRMEKGIPLGSMRSVEIVELFDQAEGGQPVSPPPIAPAMTDLASIREAESAVSALKTNEQAAAKEELSEEDIDALLANSKRTV
jgi:hypothetical protein